MHKSAVFISILLSFCIVGCTTLSEKDLDDLRSSNYIVKKEAIGKTSKEQSFPLSLVCRSFNKNIEKKAIAILVETLSISEEPEDIRLSILKTLGDLGSRIEVPVFPIIEKLKDENPLIRLQAVESLGKIKNEKAVPDLLKLLEEEPNKYPIIWALGEIGDERAIPALNKMLTSKDNTLQYNARKALKKIR